MAGLGAINPNGRRVINQNSIRRRRRRARTNWHKTAVEASDVKGVEGDGLAGLREGGLGDGVVVGRKLELDEVADIRLDVVGAVL